MQNGKQFSTADAHRAEGSSVHFGVTMIAASDE
jgi:hypothetical protein